MRERCGESSVDETRAAEREAELRLAPERLPVALSEDDWQALLSKELGCAVEVRFGRARHHVVRVQRRRRAVTVHLSSFFAEAPPPIRKALATWMRSGKRAPQATRTLDLWIEEQVRHLSVRAPKTVELRARGRHHDLAALAADLIRTEFAHAPLAPLHALGWGRARGSRSRRSLRLGSFDPVDRVVRLHPVLDSQHVPSWFVRYVLFHELLHAAIDAPTPHSGRRVIHGAEFRRRERDYHDTARALEWEKLHIQALIRCARAERPFEPTTTMKHAAASTQNPTKRSWLQRLLF